MNNYVDKSRGRMIILLGVLLAALWLVIAHAALEDARQEKYDGRVRPGVVESGTRTAAPTPVYVVPRPRTGVPMVSGNAVRSYAHSGHATMPSMASGIGMKMHTTSSARLHTYGSGGNGGGGMVNSGGSASSSRGITYGSPYVSIPVLALNAVYTNPTVASSYEPMSEAATAPARTGRVVRKTPGTEGTWEGETYTDGDGLWTWDGEGWTLTTPEGTTKTEGGITYVFHNGNWEVLNDQGDPNAPVGATPWLMMLMLAAGYCIAKTIRKKQNAI